jgi:predicted Zn-ribbon and HTH transcriptional regulator
MAKYKCKNCGYSGNKLIFQFTDYTYCIASNNKEEPEFLTSVPKWVEDKGVGEASIGEPVGCPKCHSWGINNFEEN